MIMKFISILALSNVLCFALGTVLYVLYPFLLVMSKNFSGEQSVEEEFAIERSDAEEKAIHDALFGNDGAHEGNHDLAQNERNRFSGRNCMSSWMFVNVVIMSHSSTPWDMYENMITHAGVHGKRARGVT